MDDELQAWAHQAQLELEQTDEEARTLELANLELLVLYEESLRQSELL